MEDIKDWRKEWEKLKCNATQCGAMIGFENEKDVKFIEGLLQSQEKGFRKIIETVMIENPYPLSVFCKETRDGKFGRFAHNIWNNCLVEVLEKLK